MGGRRFVLALLSVAACLWPLPAVASFIPIDDPEFGFGALTRDTATGLEWLDLPLSVDRSFDEVADEFGPGGEFEGLRHASRDEVKAVFGNAGLPNGDGLSGPSADLVAPIESFQGFFGVTRDTVQGSPPTGTEATIGLMPYTDECCAQIAGLGLTTDFWFDESEPPPGVVYETRGGVDLRTGSSSLVETGFSSPDFGHWLVRESSAQIPEPTSGLLYGLGLAVVAGRRWRA